MNPSVRPSQHEQAFLDAAWTLTCTLGARTLSVPVKVARGAVARWPPRTCGGAGARGSATAGGGAMAPCPSAQ